MERFSTIKHECVHGHVYPIARGSQAHNAISANVVALLRAAVRGGPCRVYTVEIRGRQADGTWDVRQYGPDETIVLTALEATLSIAAIYEDVDVLAG